MKPSTYEPSLFGGRVFDFGFERLADFFLCRTLGASAVFFFLREDRVFVVAFLTFFDLPAAGFRVEFLLDVVR